VELIGKDKGYNSSHVYCQVKGWSKKSYETFSNDFEKGFENGMMEWKKMDSRKKILMLKYFSPLKILTSPFYLQTLWAFLFASTFFNIFLSLSLSFFNALSLWRLGEFDDKWGEKHSSKISFQMKWNGMAKPWL
jgi:hypothetical protein